MNEAEQLRDLAESVLRYDELIEEVARQRGLTGGSGTGAWSVDGALGEQLDARYFEVMAKARAALAEVTEGWALRSDSLKSRAMHYFRDGRSLCARHWPQKRVTLHPEARGMTCPECLQLSIAPKGES
jgi:hypothetical protein